MDTVELIEAYVDALNAVDWGRLENCLDDDLVYDAPSGTRMIGRDAYRRALAEWRKNLGNPSVADLVVMTDTTGRHGAAEYTLRGRHADGANVSIPVGDFFEIENGRILRISTRLDARSFDEWGADAHD